MAVKQLFLPANRAFNSNGLAVPGAKAFLYLSGGTTPALFYADSGLVTSLGSSITATGSGRFSPAYQSDAVAFRLVITDADGVELDDIDPYYFGSTYGPSTDETLATLALGSGSSLVGFVQTGTGAVARTVQATLRDSVSVFDFMTTSQIADVQANIASLDVTTNIQAAIDSLGTAGGKIFFPRGTYKLTAAITVPNAGISFVGESRWKTILLQSTLTAGIISATGAFFNLSGLSLAYNGTPLVGGVAIYSQGSYSHFNDFTVLSAETGVYLKTGAAQKLTNFEILDYQSIGLRVEALNDAFVSKFIINAGNDTRGTLGGIRLIDQVEAFVCCDGDVLLGVWSMTSTATSYTLGNRPAYNNFTNVFFDSSVNGVSLDRLVETEFVGCWFSGGRSGAGAPGCTVNTCDSLTFTNTRFFNCGAEGCLVNETAVRTHFIACKFESNSVTTGAGISHGLSFAVNTTDFLVSGSIGHNGLYTGTQGYAIFVPAGCNYFVLVDNNVRGNLTGGILDQTVAATDKKVAGNIGYRTTNYGASTIAIGQTVTNVTHGLSVTPLAEEIVLGFTTNASDSSVTSLRTASINATTFQIVSNAAVAANILGVSWMARAGGA